MMGLLQQQNEIDGNNSGDDENEDSFFRQREPADSPQTSFDGYLQSSSDDTASINQYSELEQKGQHPLTGQRASNLRLLANQ